MDHQTRFKYITDANIPLDEQINNSRKQHPAPLICFDSSVARKLTENPASWDRLYDDFVHTFGLDIRPIWSYYLLFEFLGIRKEKLGIKENDFVEMNTQFNNIKSKQHAAKETDTIGTAFDTTFQNIFLTIEQKFATPRINELFTTEIQTRITVDKPVFRNNAELLSILFQDILNVFFNDYKEFSRLSAMHLAWDCFCNIGYTGISTKLLREAQLSIWRELWYKQNVLLPFGKIIDDLDELNNKNSRFKGREDMVDAEAITYVLMGLRNDQGKIEPVNFITFDKSMHMQPRIESAIRVFLLLEKDPTQAIERNFGQVYCYDENMVLEKILPITIP